MTLATWVAADNTTLALDGTQGVKVLRGVQGLDGPPMASVLDARVAGDGAVRVTRRRPERAFTLPLLVDTTVITSGEIVRLFQGPGSLTADSGRQLNKVEYDSGLQGTWSADTGGVDGMNFRKFAVNLLALDPYWYGNVEAISGTFDAATPWNAAIPWDSAIPWNGGASTTVSNAGSETTPVTVVLVGAATSVSMSVNGVGGWETAQPILSGGYLTVNGVADRRGPHRGPHGMFASPDGPTDWGLLTEGSQLFELPAGTSSVVFGASGTDGSTAWHLYWSPRHLTP